MVSLNKSKTGISRRDFLKTSAMTAAGLSAGLMASGNYAYAAGSDTIRVGLIGCGGRGTGAAANCVESSSGVELVAMGDVFADRLNQSKERLKEQLGDAFKVTDDNSFVGFDNYKNVIASDADLIILATPPGFRPEHYKAAVEAGKHVFMEKPVAVDPVGIRVVLDASDVARQKGLGVVAGTQRRHSQRYNEAIKRIHDGAIGDVVGGEVYWNQGSLWKRDRQPDWTDTEWQMRNWLYFTWLSGDHIVEQHVHNIDVANWVLQSHPIKAVGMGGRQARTSPDYGHIYDHFAIIFEYPNGTRITSMCRQQEGCKNYVGEHIVGTRGTSDPNGIINGDNPYSFEGKETNPYVQEHTDLIASIREGKPLNEGRQVAESVLAAIMGREAAYTGKEITWDEILNSNLSIFPENLEFGPLPVPEVPIPGQTTLERPAWYITSR